MTALTATKILPTCIITVFIFFLVYYHSQPEEPIFKTEINTKGCHIKQLDPFSKEALPYIKKEKRVVCSPHPPLVLSNQTSIWIDEKSRTSRKLSKELICCYRAFWRTKNTPKNAGKQLDFSVEYNKKCIPFNNSVNIYNEYIEVKCTEGKKEVYRDYHAFIITERRKTVSKRTSPTEKPSVLIIGIDSLSRANLYRQMPKTLEYVTDLGGIELRGHSKIGDNTFPNVVGMFMGLTLDEIKNSCWPSRSTFFDGCKLMWDDFHNNGYVTAFAEDTSYMGLFLYLKKGFWKQPTDIYTQPYMYLNEDPVPKGIGHNYNGFRACSGSRLAMDVLFDYSKKFVLNMTAEDLPYWGYFWGTSLSHDYLNVPPNADEIYKDVFQTFNESGVFNNTLVIFMSDHGLRFGSFRKTYQGYLEERLPFAFIMVPQWIKDQFPLAMHNLEQNSYKLTTHFDTRATMLDVLQNRVFGYGPERNERSLSLFTPISDKRNCLTASIPEHYCTCLQSEEISVENVEVQWSANAVVAQINKMLKSFKKCSELGLKKVHTARLVDQQVLSDTREITLMMETYPGKGMFEATVNYNESSSKVKVLGDISRTNTYGNSSYCIDDKLLKLYCYCK